MGFMVDKVELEEVSLRVLRVSEPVLIPSIIYVSLTTAIWTRNLKKPHFQETVLRRTKSKNKCALNPGTSSSTYVHLTIIDHTVHLTIIDHTVHLS